MNNSSLTSKRTHVWSDNDSDISSNFLRFLKFFYCSDRVPKCQREREGIEASIWTIFMRFLFLSPRTSSQNPNGQSVRNWISNNISKFHNNPTVNETGIVVLPRQLWVSAGKKKATMRRVFLSVQTWYRNSQRCECSELCCKRGYQISQRSNGEWVRDCHFSKIDLVGYGKKKRFWGGGEGKQNWKNERS